MRILVVGIDHTTAPIELRERVACSVRQIPQILTLLRSSALECALLSTCNRTELYAVYPDAWTFDEGEHQLLGALSTHGEMPLDEIKRHSFVFTDEAAAAHLCGVASGIYSLVPGEPQIQGQVAEALEMAQAGGFAGPILSALFRTALVCGKRARTETGISRNAASISHVAVQLARRLFPDLREASILLVGSGQMSELAARNLRDNGAGRLVIVNRTDDKARELARELSASHRAYTELSTCLVEADVVISSTIAPYAILTREVMQRVTMQRAGRSLLLIDIALPRDIEPEVATLPGVHLYNLDDLQAEVQRGLSLRQQEIDHVRQIINAEVELLLHRFASLSVVDTISDLRQHMEDLRQQELTRIMQKLAPTLSEREVAAIKELTSRLMNKFMHTPMARLKDAAASGQGHIYAEALRYLFDLEQQNEANYHRDAGQQARLDANTLGDRTITTAVAPS